jgi:outer membrane lipoprotein-sorting protein
MKRFFLTTLLLTMAFAILFMASAQDLINAADIFNKASDFYAKLNNLQANIKITKGDKTQSGVLYYDRRNLLKIEFYEPIKQVILVTRDNLQVYIPSNQTILEQQFDDSSTGLDSSGGFSILKSNYSVSFAEAGLVPLSPGSGEQVYKLSLYPYAGSKEGFKYIIMSVLPESFLIRRIEAVNIKNERIVFDYSSIVVNPQIPISKFTIETPNLTNVYPNFLYGAEE